MFLFYFILFFLLSLLILTFHVGGIERRRLGLRKRMSSRVTGDLLVEQYEHLFLRLSKYGISEIIQLKSNGKLIPLLSLDLFDFSQQVMH